MSNKEADKLNLEGVALLAERKFEKAAAKFLKASEKCSNDHRNRSLFIENWNLARSKFYCEEGKRKIFDNKFEAVIKLFRLAFESASNAGSDEYLNEYREMEVYALHQYGLQLFRESDLAKAQAILTVAFEHCFDGYRHINELKEDFSFVEAEFLNAAGDTLFASENFKEALGKFKAACDICPEVKQDAKKKFTDNAAKAAKV